MDLTEFSSYTWRQCFCWLKIHHPPKIGAAGILGILLQQGKYMGGISYGAPGCYYVKGLYSVCCNGDSVQPYGRTLIEVCEARCRSIGVGLKNVFGFHKLEHVI